MPVPVREGRAMIAGMDPSLLPGELVFCSIRDAGLAGAALPSARAVFFEDEGVSLVLPVEAALSFGFEAGAPMRQITLRVHSALDGVGLTAAVAGALAAEGIPCNVIAAFHHDHLFVPVGMAERALSALRALQASAAD